MEVSPLPTPAPGGVRVSLGGLAPRLAVVLGAVLVVVGAGRAVPVPVAALVVGVLLAVGRPAVVGAWVALPAAVVSFTAATGSDVGVRAALLAAAGIYLVHTGTAAAAVFPWSARVPRAVAARWLVRCVPAVVLTGAVAGVDAVVGQTPRSTLFAVAATAVVLVAAALLFRLLAAAGDPAAPPG